MADCPPFWTAFFQTREVDLCPDAGTTWDVATAAFSGATVDVSGLSTELRGFDFNSDGSVLYVVAGGFGSSVVYKFTLSAPFELSTATYSGVSAAIGTRGSAAIVVDNADTQIYIGGQGFDSDEILQYVMPSAGDLGATSSAGNGLFLFSGNPYYITGAYITPDGLRLFLSGVNGGGLEGGDPPAVYQYSMSTAWDTSSASYDGVSYAPAPWDSNPGDAYFKPSGDRMFLLTAALTGGVVTQYPVASPMDLSTVGAESGSFDASAQVSTPLAVRFDAGGTRMYIADGFSATIYQYTL